MVDGMDTCGCFFFPCLRMSVGVGRTGGRDRQAFFESEVSVENRYEYSLWWRSDMVSATLRGLVVDRRDILRK